MDSRRARIESTRLPGRWPRHWFRLVLRVSCPFLGRRGNKTDADQKAFSGAAGGKELRKTPPNSLVPGGESRRTSDEPRERNRHRLAAINPLPMADLYEFASRCCSRSTSEIRNASNCDGSATQALHR